MNANARNFDPSGTRSYYSQEANYYHQENCSSENVSGYCSPEGNNTGYQDYIGEQYFDQYGNASSFNQWEESEVIETLEPGYLSPLPHLVPQIYSSPVSAVAYDEGYLSIYVASHTQPFGERSRRASMLVTHSTINGSLYSSCGGHPEADLGVLRSVYKSFFCGDYQHNCRNQHLPIHAFQPPYGATVQQPHGAQLGISELIAGTTGYITSVSPAGVRIHTVGGLCVSDFEVSGMMCGTPHLESKTTHVSVGGCHSKIYCLDLYQGLRVVSSHSLQPDVGVMALSSNDNKQALVAGCSDGTLRFIDGRMRGAELARIKGHTGGVTGVTSSGDGNLVATTGFAAKSHVSPVPVGLYAYPDPHLLMYDVRYLGRGGIVHPFSGMKGSPRMLSFLPDMDNQPRNRLLVASGQAEGGMQIITPFEESDKDPLNFIFPSLDQGEAMTCMTLSNQFIAVGTSQSRVLQFELTGYNTHQTKSAKDTESSMYVGGSMMPSATTQTETNEGTAAEKTSLEVPNFYPDLPPLSINPLVLLKEQPVGSTLPTSVFSSYIMCSDPLVSSVGSREESTFGAVARNPLVPTPRRTVAKAVIDAGSKSQGDTGLMVPTSVLKIDLLPKREVGNTRRKDKGAREPFANPNKLLYSDKLASECYLPDNRRKGEDYRGKTTGRGFNSGFHERLADESAQSAIPKRYRLKLRPQNIVSPYFEYCNYNGTGIWPGWDYPPSMPSAHAPSVLVLLYFVSEVKSAMMEHQFDERLYSSRTVNQVPTLSTELGFLFHNIDSISQNAMAYPGREVKSHVGVFMPSSLLTAFKVMPEAVNLALLDDNPAVAVTARRPEAFYRFLLHHLDKEAGAKGEKPLDLLHGINFVSVNEFINGRGKPTVSTTRALTLDLSYDPFLKARDATIKWRFGQILRYSLCRESRLRAWCKASKSYETVVQRKVATCLPEMLSISCSCAGRNDEGLAVWRTSFNDYSLWLPELVEIDLEDAGNIKVREQVDVGENEKKWVNFEGDSCLSESITNLVNEHRESKTNKMRYRLEAVLSFVRNDLGLDSSKQLSPGQAEGHHILHIRVPPDYRKRALTKQREYAEQLYNQLLNCDGDGKENHRMVLTSKTQQLVVRNRIGRIENSLKSEQSNDWVLFNGFVVSPTSVEDARAFHVTFKEPCLVVYRVTDETPMCTLSITKQEERDVISAGNVMFSESISTGNPSKYAAMNESDFPGTGDIVALDAEFVSVQEEEAILGDNGNKIVLRETRHALARISVIDCRTGNIIIDDHVVPREPVVDYLTRFSGIVPGDLDPKNSPHHLVTARTAYLKLRFLMERGCIFLGHGLSQDFLTVNLYVPPPQIIDTVEIYHKDRMRYVSLRFLTNYVLNRDMQQQVHDSVEDAKAAWELYKKATELKEEGSFENFLEQLYQYGAKVEWSFGV